MGHDSILTTREVARMLSISTRTLERWRKSHTGPSFIQIGKGIRYKAIDVEEWMENNKGL